jgi:serine/threonine protein kinase
MLADFGISFIQEGNTKTGARTNTHGTVRYEPPEASYVEHSGRLTFEKSLDWKGNVKYRKTSLPGDVFSLGCVFYEMLRTIQLVSKHPGPSIDGEKPYDVMVKDGNFDKPFDWTREKEQSLSLLPQQYQYGQLVTSFLQHLASMVLKFQPGERCTAGMLFSYVQSLMDSYNLRLPECSTHGCRSEGGVGDEEEVEMDIDEDD